MKYWLVKTEPGVFSWDDLKRSPDQTTTWEGVRNYQARNFIREMQLGDPVLFYHSSVRPQAVMGTAKVVQAAYPDHFAFDPTSKYYDPKSSAAAPRWFMVDIQYVEYFEPAITLEELRQVKGLSGMMLLQKGCRLSVQPVTLTAWEIVQGLRR